MAKKKTTLTPDQRLKEALVPKSDQPYEIPANWCWVTLSELVKPSKEKTSDFSDCSLKYIGLENIEKNGGISTFSSALGIKSLKNVFHENQILYGKLRPYLNKHDIASFDGVCSTDILVFSTTSITSPKFINNYLNHEQFIEYAISNSKGINLPRVTENILLKAICPLPPPPEQQRIVDRIESLFSKLDEAKEKAQMVFDSFETRKAAILHQAFTGKLTANWRKEHNNSAFNYLNKIKENGNIISRKELKFWGNNNLPKGWAESKIGNLLYIAGRIGWKGLKAEEYTKSGPFLLSVYNLNDGDEVTYQHVYHISNARYDESPEIMVHVGDILLTKDGAGIGKLGYIKTLPQKATINSSLLLIRSGNVAIPKYIFYVLSGPNLQHIVKERITGSATPHLFQRDIKEFLLPIPSLEEQTEIVRILDDLLAKERHAKEAAESVLEKIDLIKKSILARAFRGELGTNDPSEPSSIDLLKEIFEKEK